MKLESNEGKKLEAIVAEREELVLVYFWADLHEACSEGGQVDQILSVAETKFGEKVVIVKSNALEVQEFAEKCGVTMVPSFCLFRGGKSIGQYEGTVASKVMGLVEEHLGSSMGKNNLQENLLQTLELEKLNDRLTNLTRAAKVMVFMKGTKDEPKCKFSRELMKILSEEKVSFSTFNILEDNEIREGLKTFSNWNTYPQVYAAGNLVGGLDSIKQMLGEEVGSLTQKLEAIKLTEASTSTKFSVKPPQEPAPSLNERLKQLINQSTVTLFMKGDPEAPQCGFSNTMVGLLKEADIEFTHFDILSDEEVRQGLKTYSDWPTFPQLYVKGDLVGGLDILKEMLEEDEPLKEQLGLIDESDLNGRLLKLINQSKIMLFMKGDRVTPQCGFSRTMVQILEDAGAKFDTFDILSDEEVRQGLKSFSDWPTFPQLYVDGELVGGLDIVKELQEDGELLETLQM